MFHHTLTVSPNRAKAQVRSASQIQVSTCSSPTFNHQVEEQLKLVVESWWSQSSSL